jgi:hypothetical protein
MKKQVLTVYPEIDGFNEIDGFTATFIQNNDAMKVKWLKWWLDS